MGMSRQVHLRTVAAAMVVSESVSSTLVVLVLELVSSVLVVVAVFRFRAARIIDTIH